MARHPGLNPRNEEWIGTPKRSRYGAGFRNALGRLVGHPAPVVAHNVRDGATGFRNQFGVVVNSVPYPGALVAMSTLRDYNGQAPLRLAPFLNKPRPWQG